MERHCSKCGAQLNSQWNFCPHCGGAMLNKADAMPGEVDLSEEIEKTQKNPAPGAFGGLLFGVLAVPILVIVGGMLCLTGLGAILGIPMIIAAVLAPLLGPMFGMSAHRGKCPFCGTVVTDIHNTEICDCPVCNQRFALKDREISKAA